MSTLMPNMMDTAMTKVLRISIMREVMIWMPETTMKDTMKTSAPPAMTGLGMMVKTAASLGKNARLTKSPAHKEGDGSAGHPACDREAHARRIKGLPHAAQDASQDGAPVRRRMCRARCWQDRA